MVDEHGSSQPSIAAVGALFASEAHMCAPPPRCGSQPAAGRGIPSLFSLACIHPSHGSCLVLMSHQTLYACVPQRLLQQHHIRIRNVVVVPFLQQLQRCFIPTVVVVVALFPRLPQDSLTNEQHAPGGASASARYNSNSVRLCNNHLLTLQGIERVLFHILDDPAEMVWLDVSCNGLTSIEDIVLKFPKLQVTAGGAEGGGFPWEGGRGALTSACFVEQRM